MNDSHKHMARFIMFIVKYHILHKYLITDTQMYMSTFNSI